MDPREEIQKHLADYLSEKGIDTKKLFPCINPDHKDSNPSMKLLPSMDKVYCHGCNITGDIFWVASVMENLPEGGAGWFTDNYLMLAKKYNVEVGPISKEVQVKSQLSKIFNDIVLYLTTTPLSDLAVKEFEDRGWDKNIHENYNIGVIEDTSKFVNYLTQQYNIEELMNAGVLIDQKIKNAGPKVKTLFEENRLIFTIRDPKGSVIGFASRDLLWEKGKSEKYTNLAATKPIDIYKKRRRLYGFDDYLKSSKSGEPLWIVEGYADRITMVQAGIQNCVAVGGTSFTEEHVNELLKNGVTSIIFCFDGDEPGVKRVDAILNRIPLFGLSVKVVFLPENHDPDSYLRVYSIEDFLSLERKTAFEWKLSLVDIREDSLAICKEIIPIIAVTLSATERSVMIETLSEATGIDILAIKADVDYEINKSTELGEESVEAMVKNAIQILKKCDSTADAEQIMRHTADDIADAKLHQKDSILSEHTFLDLIENKIPVVEDEITGSEFKAGSLGKILYQFGPNWSRGGNVIALGGKPNVGKSALVAQLGIELSYHNEDVTVVMLSIDDSANVTTDRVILSLIHEKFGLDTRLELNAISRPNVIRAKYPSFYEEFLKMRADAFQELKSLALQSKFIIKDSMQGSSLPFLSTLVRRYRSKYPDRKIIFILDNFHNLEPSDGGAMVGSETVKTASSRMKRLMERNECSLITTVEYKKIEAYKRPTLNDIAESNGPAYHSKVIMSIYSDLAEHQADGTEENTVHSHTENGKVYPINEIIFSKNKLSSFKGKLWSILYPQLSYYKILDESDIMAPKGYGIQEAIENYTNQGESNAKKEPV